MVVVLIVPYVKAFIERLKDPTRPVLLGLSGGADSLCLFRALLECGCPFAVAHIDHGWRPESGAEAEELKHMADLKKIPFHLKRLDPSCLRGNLEAACREERLQFFKELCLEYGYQAVLLGHHADDRAETVLKHVLEGASLPYLNSLSELSVIDGMNIWRPLLNFTKNEIIASLEGQKYFIDSTNEDPKYMRGKMRSRIVPDLSEAYGKNISATLNRLGNEAAELKSYLKEKLKNYLENIVSGPYGSYLNFVGIEHPLEVRFLLRQLCERENCFLSHALIEEASRLVLSGAANKRVMMGERRVEIDRGRVFVLKKDLVQMPSVDAQTNWESVWKGQIPINKSEQYSASVKKILSNRKVPAFLWSDHKL